MPAIINTLRVESDVIAASLTIDLPTGYAVDDYLFAFLAQDGGGTAITTATSGWTALGTYAGNQGSGSRWFYKRCTSTSETAPTFAGSNDDWGYVVHVVRGVNTSNPVNVVDRTDWGNGTTVHQFTTGTPTTTADNCLVLIGVCGDNNAQFFQDETLFPLAAGNSSNAIGFMTGYYNKYTQGALTGKTIFVDQADEGGNAWTICVENATSGPMMPDPGTATRVIDYHNINTGRTFTAPNAEFTTIDSQSMDSALTVSFTAVNADPGRWASYTTVNSTSSSLDWAGAVYALSGATDLSNSVFSLIWRLSSTAQTGTKGFIIVFKDNAGSWVAYQLSKRAGLTIVPAYYTSHIALGSATPLDSSGVMDWTNVVKIGYFYQRNNSATGMTFQVFNAAYTKRDGHVTGGSSVTPVNTATPALLALGTNRSGFDKAGLQGKKQYLMKQHVQFGDGSTTTYVDMDGCSIETLDSYNYAAGRRWWNVSDDFLYFTIKACAACTMKFRNFVMAPSVRVLVTIDSASSTSASYDFSGSSWSNVTFTSKTGITVNSAIFTNCTEIDAKGGTFSACLFSNSQTANSTIKLDDGASLLNCSFTAKNASDYAVRIPAVGTYTLDGSTFSGYTTAINITAVSGTVTLHLALGQSVPTYQTAGATVVIDQPVVTATGSVTGMPAGGRLYIYNVTTATEMVNAVQAGTSYSTSYPTGTGYSAGDVIKMRWRKANYENVELTTTATSGGWSFTVSTTTDVHYSSTTPANVTVDYANKKIRATSTRDTFTAQEVIDIIKNAEETEDGIRLSTFAEITGLVELTPNTYTALTANLLDWQLSWAAGSVAQAFVTGGNVVGGLSGDLIEDVTGGPQVSIQQAQAGTVVTVGSGVLPSDITAIAEAVRTELATEMARIDVAISTRLAASGYTSPPSAATNASAVRTELATELTKITETHKIQGLDATAPMTVTPSSRVAGTISLAITGDGETTSTVTRS